LQARSCCPTGSPCSQTRTQVSVQRSDVPRLKSTAKVFWDGYCWACFTLPSPSLTLPPSTTISVIFHTRPTSFRCFLCFPGLHVKPEFGCNTSPTLNLLASSSQVNQRSQGARLEAGAVGRHRVVLNSGGVSPWHMKAVGSHLAGRTGLQAVWG